MGAEGACVPLPEACLPPDGPCEPQQIENSGIFGHQTFAHEAKIEAQESIIDKPQDRIYMDYMTAAILMREKEEIRNRMEPLTKGGTRQLDIQTCAEAGRAKNEPVIASIYENNDIKAMKESKDRITTGDLPRIAAQVERVEFIMANRKRKMNA